jgi:hypothetical protein
MTTIYVAGASAEAEMVSKYIETLERAGLAVTFDWTRPVLANRAKGICDRDMSPADRSRHAFVDLDAVSRAEFFWLVIPEKTSHGCWIELGHALALRKIVVVSGDHGRSIFTSLSHLRFEKHEEALAWLHR